eukprot:1149744-Pelagomonas_calceolata.AAC.1
MSLSKARHHCKKNQNTIHNPHPKRFTPRLKANGCSGASSLENPWKGKGKERGYIAAPAYKGSLAEA